ncbi:MAG: 2-hydroxyacid dehydrogenase [Flavobacterium sp.]|nr:MAG: 2-hydroxyacid dehydrogenase [Flavobacterium sp.]
MKVAVFSAHRFEIPFLEAADDFNQLVLINESLCLDNVHKAKGCEAVSIFVTDDGSREVLKRLSEIGVRYIVLRSAGYNNVDLEAAVEYNLKVAHVADYSPYAVAEHSVALMLALNRHLAEANLRVRQHNFCLDGLMGFDMHNRTVGIIGTGKIGSQTAKILLGFGCQILAFDPKVNEELVNSGNVEYVDLDTLLKRSDIISLHAPLNDQTRNLINQESISKMKTGVMLINTGRGAMVNTADVIYGLTTGKIGYVGLDVYENENGLFFEDHSTELLLDETFARLLSLRNVLVTSHQGFLTDTALRNIAEDTALNLECFENGTIPENVLVPAQSS